MRTTRRGFLRSAALSAAAIPLTQALPHCAQAAEAKAKPNFVIIFTDDQGYADAGCFGAKDIKTPNLDTMAKQGVKFTDFYVAATVCTPSRAALMTGCYPKRVGLHEAVLFPQSKHGLNPKEITIADMLKTKGYSTACVGKWHLGHHKQFLPTRQGFDIFWGLPYSNDMSRDYLKRKNYPKLPLMDQEKAIELEPDQTQLTRRLTEKACQFIKDSKDKPFFLYLAHPMPHLPWNVSDKFKGTSKRGLYGDVIQEIDWSVGEVLKTLKQAGVDDNTWVMFCSDNGSKLLPRGWRGHKGGQATPLRGGKAQTWEGGQREPTIMRWPGKLPAGKVCSQLATTMDILPTIAHLTGAALPNHQIDGKNIWNLMTKPETAKTPHEAFYYYARNGKVEAVRCGNWKLHIAKVYGWNRKKDGPFKTALYDLGNDISESKNVAAKHPDIVKKLTKMIKDFDAHLDKTARPAGKL